MNSSLKKLNQLALQKESVLEQHELNVATRRHKVEAKYPKGMESRKLASHNLPISELPTLYVLC